MRSMPDPRPPQIDAIELGIVETLTALATKALLAKWKYAEWTRHVKEDLCELGLIAGYCVCSSLPRVESKWMDKEWLYDLAWLAYEGKNTGAPLVGVELVVESEWKSDQDEIDYDFDKLVSARSSHRLLVVDGTDAASAKRQFDYQVARVVAFRDSQIGDRYLFATYMGRLRAFSFHLYVHGAGIAPFVLA